MPFLHGEDSQQMISRLTGRSIDFSVENENQNTYAPVALKVPLINMKFIRFIVIRLPYPA